MNIENINLTEELILKAGACKTSEELLALALENGIDITPEQLPELMAEVAKKCSGEVSDDALEVAGAVGGKGGTSEKKIVEPLGKCNNFRCRECTATVEHGAFGPYVRHGWSCKNIYKEEYQNFFCKDCFFANYGNGLLICCNV